LVQSKANPIFGFAKLNGKLLTIFDDKVLNEINKSYTIIVTEKYAQYNIIIMN